MESIHEGLLEEFYQNARGVFKRIEESGMEKIVDLLLDAKKIYVLGIGHSGMFGRVLSMKLNHVGLTAYTVFDEINPPMGRDDVFIAISQSGETKTIVTLAEKAKKIGGRVVGIVSSEKSTLGTLADTVLRIPKVDEDTQFTVLSAIGDRENQNLLGSLFGFDIYVLFYALVLMLAKKRGESAESIDARHANLQ